MAVKVLNPEKLEQLIAIKKELAELKQGIEQRIVTLQEILATDKLHSN
jgi:hypothetical protein